MWIKTCFPKPIARIFQRKVAFHSSTSLHSKSWQHFVNIMVVSKRLWRLHSCAQVDGPRVPAQLAVFKQIHGLVVRCADVGDVRVRHAALLRVQQPRGNRLTKFVHFCCDRAPASCCTRKEKKRLHAQGGNATTRLNGVGGHNWPGYVWLRPGVKRRTWRRRVSYNALHKVRVGKRCEPLLAHNTVRFFVLRLFCEVFSTAMTSHATPTGTESRDSSLSSLCHCCQTLWRFTFSFWWNVVFAGYKSLQQAYWSFAFTVLMMVTVFT